MQKRNANFSCSMLAMIVVFSVFLLIMGSFSSRKPAYAQLESSQTAAITLARGQNAIINDTETAQASASFIPSLTLNSTEMRSTLNVVVQRQFTLTAIRINTQTAAAIYQNTVNAEVNTLLTATAQHLPAITLTPLLGQTSPLQQTQSIDIAARLNTLQAQFTQTASVSTVNAKAYSLLTATAQNLPSPNAVEKEGTFAALIGNRSTQTEVARGALTVTAVLENTVQFGMHALATATTAAKLTDLRANLELLTVDNATAANVKQLMALQAPGVTAISFSPDGEVLASASTDRTIRLWNVKTGEQINVLPGFSDRLDVVFNADGTRLASTSSDGTVRLWNLQTLEEVLAIRGAQPLGGKAVAISPDSDRLASVGNENIVTLWDAIRGTRIYDLKGHTGPLTGVAFSPDGLLLASSSSDNTIRVWEIKTGTQVSVFKSVAGGANALAFNPDGSLIAGAGAGTIQLLDPLTGKVVVTMLGNAGGATGVAFSPSGKLLASSGADKFIRLWNADTGGLLFSVKAHQQGVNDIAFSSDGARFASSSSEGIIRIWGIPKG